MANIYKQEQLTEQSTTSSTFIDIPGTTLQFTPGSTDEIWLIFASGKCYSSATTEQPYEMTLVINGTDEDLWSHQNSTASAPAGFLVFDRITGTVAQQTVKLQYKALSGTVYADDIRVVAAKLPSGADFQFYQSDGIVETTGSNVTLGSLQFTPSSSGNYYIFGKISHREHPGGSTSQAWFEDVGDASPLHPNAPTDVHHSNSREPWNPTTCFWRTNFDASLQTINIRFTSSGGGSQGSEHRYRKVMAFREDAFDDADFSLSASESTTTSPSFQTKNSVSVPAPSSTSEYLILQAARLGGDNSSSRKSGELRAAGSAVIRTDHKINRDNSASQGYHHTVGLGDVKTTSNAITYANGFLSPDSITVNCAESAIAVLRYPALPTENSIFFGTVA
jgi:hypothetical protein